MDKVVIYKDIEFWTWNSNYEKIYKLGRIRNGKVILAPEEVLYLLEKGKIIVRGYKDKEDFVRREKINFRKYFALRYLRDIGYYVDACDEGVIVHAKGERDNPIYLCVPLFEFDELTWKDLKEMIEEAKRIGCKLLLAFIDAEFDVVFYECKKMRFC